MFSASGQITTEYSAANDATVIRQTMRRKVVGPSGRSILQTSAKTENRPPVENDIDQGFTIEGGDEMARSRFARPARAERSNFLEIPADNTAGIPGVKSSSRRTSRSRSQVRTPSRSPQPSPGSNHPNATRTTHEARVYPLTRNSPRTRSPYIEKSPGFGELQVHEGEQSDSSASSSIPSPSDPVSNGKSKQISSPPAPKNTNASARQAPLVTPRDPYSYDFPLDGLPSSSVSPQRLKTPRTVIVSAFGNPTAPVSSLTSVTHQAPKHYPTYRVQPSREPTVTLPKDRNHPSVYRIGPPPDPASAAVHHVGTRKPGNESWPDRPHKQTGQRTPQAAYSRFARDASSPMDDKNYDKGINTDHWSAMDISAVPSVALGRDDLSLEPAKFAVPPAVPPPPPPPSPASSRNITRQRSTSNLTLSTKSSRLTRPRSQSASEERPPSERPMFLTPSAIQNASSSATDSPSHHQLATDHLSPQLYVSYAALEPPYFIHRVIYLIQAF